MGKILREELVYDLMQVTKRAIAEGAVMRAEPRLAVVSRVIPRTTAPGYGHNPLPFADHVRLLEVSYPVKYIGDAARSVLEMAPTAYQVEVVHSSGKVLWPA